MNEDRQKVWDEYKGAKNSSMQRMFLEYNRYFEAEQIKSRITENFKDLKVLDYGCGVADYALYFGRLGAKVDILDIDEEAVAFAYWRMEQEGITPEVNYEVDLVVFGEVLDHLEHPFEVVKDYVERGAKYIFTSSYPYR